MSRVLNSLLLFACLLYSPPHHAEPGQEQLKAISLAELRDKIRGGWAGQMVGVSFGFPTEFGYREELVPLDKLPAWQPQMIEASLSQDDLYVDITFAQVLDEHGLEASSADFGEMFRHSNYPLWHANLAARRALRRGVPATHSGTFQHNIHAHDIDFQIEADFIGLMSPGMPKSTNELSLRAGRVINQGDGIYGGMFISAMYAAAFFSSEPAEIVGAGLAALPPTSDYARTIGDVLGWWRKEPTDWQANWQRINDKWNSGEMCPEGIGQPFNIDARLNGAYVALGLLHGAGDFQQTMLISTRAGQDSDCNPSSALGILGVSKGYKGIPEKYTSHLPEIAEEKFLFTGYSFNDIVESSYQRALSLAVKNGGRLEDDNLWVAVQSPQAAQLQDSISPGRFKEEVNYDDKRWQWQGPWAPTEMKIWRYRHASMISDSPDAEARIGFSGSGAVLKGILLPDGGTLDVYLDGELVETIDVYSDEDSAKPQEGLWHRFELAPGEHELELRLTGEAFAESSGSRVSISSLLVFH